jgi:predicted lipid-binding transport protein (Tim44 family)
MKTFVVAVMLIATMILTATSMAAPKHTGGKHAHSTDAKPSADAAATETPAPEVVDTSLKGRLGAVAVALGIDAFATQFGVDPAWLGLIAVFLLALLLFALIVLLARLRSRARRGKAVYAGDYANSEIPERALRVEPSIRPVAPRAAQQVARSKAAAKAHGDFDVAKFLRSANTYFLRMQVAWDRGDLNDIREFTTREIYLEFKSQLRRRGEALNQTGIDSLDAELLKLESGEGNYVASVKFSGMIREEGNPAKPFMEVWSLTRAVASSSGWTLAGIQQFR